MISRAGDSMAAAKGVGMRREAGSMAGGVGRPLDIGVVAMLMILFGLAEIVTGLTHDFFGITTSAATIFTYASALIGALYAAAGALLLTMKKRAAALAVVLLG